VLPNPAFALTLSTSPTAAMVLFVSEDFAAIPIAPACTQYLDNGSLFAVNLVFAGPAGLANVPAPVPNNPPLIGLALYWQAAQLVAGGPVLGLATLSNGLFMRVGFP
jgi:hypothetical protein